MISPPRDVADRLQLFEHNERFPIEKVGVRLGLMSSVLRVRTLPKVQK
jgi:hypothetical protein